jgi:signal transduction histidine kinase
MKTPEISVRTKTLIFCIASFLLTSFILTFLAAMLVNHWKQRLVKNSYTLAEEHARKVVDDLSRIIEEDHENRVEKLKENPRAHSSIHLLLKQNENIVMAAFVDERGIILLEHYRGEETSGTAILYPGAQYTTSLPSTLGQPNLQIILKNPSDNLQELKIPLMRGEKLLGQLQFRVSENSILKNMSYSSALITRSLYILLVVLFLLLIVSYLFLWRLFSHHMALIQERDRLDKLSSIGTLASGLAHEIRNPLNAMNVNLDVIREELEDPREDSRKKSREILTNLSREIDQLNRTLSHFMKFALPGRLDKQNLDLVKLVKETIEFFAAEFEREQISIRINAPAECNIQVDPTSLKQLLMNLILNAAQAMKQSPVKRLGVNVAVDGKSCHLTIQDTGPGFGAVNPEKCFEAFYTTKEGGSGFGLPIARQVAYAHDGKLWAENAGAEGGAVLHLTLPIQT